MSAIVRTPKGFITSIKVAWQSRHDGSDVWTWRTDGDEPYRWATAAAAQDWIDTVWRDDPKEQSKAGWKVVQV